MVYQARNHMVAQVSLCRIRFSIVTISSQSLAMCRTPTGVETPDVIDLRKAQRKEPEKQLYQVHTIAINCG